MMKNFDLDRVIADGKLKYFIIGQKEYNSSRPEDDTARWNALKSYYDSLSTPLEIKAQIKKEVLSLFAEKDVTSKRICLILSRVLFLVECKELLIHFLINQELVNLDSRIQNDIWVTISYFRIKELERKLADYVVKAKILKTFLLTSRTRLNETEVSDDDLWRIALLANYYDFSNAGIRDEIELQILQAIKSGSTKINSILKKYSTEHHDSKLGIFLRKLIS